MTYFDNLLQQINAIEDPDLRDEPNLPDRKEIIYLLKELQVVLLPEYYHFSSLNQSQALFESYALAEKLIRNANRCVNCEDYDAGKIRDCLMAELPKVKQFILSDIQAIYDGDPATTSKAEIILCYPGFYAISIYRIAHVFYALGVPYIPRVMAEYAHEKTGIDINPGAIIGSHFCIDHGTGIVIGETATIGHHVKIYQGVTIGARSFDLDENGNPMKGGKRHPDIGDYVVIYANATILGGDTIVGNHCVIGGNVWLIHSIPDYEKIYYSSKS